MALLGTALIALAAAPPAKATEADDAADTQRVETGDEIIVTGTRRAERTVADSSVPVDIVGGDELGSVVSADLNDKLAQLVPSFNIQRLPGFDGANFVRPATLRGLSPDQTLVLVNGRRRHRSAYIQLQQFGAQAVDLSEIPQIAVRQIEVLRDGASAQYGSDAIAGVINILLEDRPGIAFDAQVSQYYEGDGENIQIAGRYGAQLGEAGRINISVEHVDANSTDRSPNPLTPSGQPDLRSTRAFVNFAYDLGAVELYGFGNYGKLRGSYVFNWRDPTGSLFNRSFFQDNPPFLYPDFNLTDVYPDGFLPRFISNGEDASLVGGVRGTSGDFSWDVGARYGRNRIDYRVENSINASLGPLSPTEFYAGSWIQEEEGINADFVYLWDIGIATPLNVSFGAEWRREAFELRAGELASYVIGPLSDLVPGSNSYPGPSPEQAGRWGRNSYAAYLDLDADITERLNLGVATRYEHFGDFGDTWNFKLSGRYGLTSWLNLRGAVSSGFHAPSPGQQNLTNTTQGPDPLRPPPLPQVILTSGLIPPTNPVAEALGGQPLQPEEALNISLGLAARPAPNLTISLDFYRIDIDDRLGITNSITLSPGQKAALLAAGVDEAASLDTVRFFINGYDTRSEGLDLVVAWRAALGPGRLGLTGVYNHNRSKIRGGDPLVVTDSLRVEVEDRRPRDTAILTAAYDIGRFSLLARGRYYGAWTDALQFLPAEFLQRVGAEVFVDLAASYRIVDGLTITVGVENLFDNYPDTGGPLSAFGNPYPLLRPYEADGGRYYLRVSGRF
jgi:iron complex outermembrane receptor protein